MAITAQQAFEKAGKGETVIGWKLDDDQRTELLQQFPPRYDQIVADHVTLAAKVASDAELPFDEVAEVLGRSDDGRGVEALVVSIGGTTKRPDGSTYHITWSLGDGRRAVESNDVIRKLGWKPFDLPMPVQLTAARF